MGAPVALQAVDMLVAGETEVCELQVQLLVDQDVFKFEVAVGDRVLEHELHRVQHLVREKTASVLAHRTDRLADVEEKTTLDVLHRQVDQIVDYTT